MCPCSFRASSAKRQGITLDEDEIAYIALHLGGALETQKELANRVPAVLYCPSYYNMDSSLADRISRRMQGKILLTNVFTKESLLDQLTGCCFAKKLKRL